MSHVQVLHRSTSTLTRTLGDRSGRLQQLPDHAGDHTGKRPRQPDGRRSGPESYRGEPMLYVASPDFSQLRTNYLKARDASRSPTKLCSRPGSCTSTSHRSERSGQAESAEVQASGDLASAEAALKVWESAILKPWRRLLPRLRFRCWHHCRRGRRAGCIRGQLLQPGNTQCFMISNTSTVWVLVNVYQKDLPYVNRRSCHHPDRCLS